MLSLFLDEIAELPTDTRRSTPDSSAFPVLVTHQWCPFTDPIVKLWLEAGAQSNRTLRLVQAESEEGTSVIETYDVRGVPCMLPSADRRVYGMLPLEEATEILQTVGQ